LEQAIDKALKVQPATGVKPPARKAKDIAEETLNLVREIERTLDSHEPDLKLGTLNLDARSTRPAAIPQFHA
jgi:hypothetical protein